MDFPVKPVKGGPDREFNPGALDPELFKLYSYEFAQKTRAVPFGYNGQEIYVAMLDPYDMEATDDLYFALSKYKVVLYEASEDLITAALVRWSRTQASQSEKDAIEDLEFSSADGAEEASVEEGQVSLLVSKLLEQAVERDASDIHFLPNDHELVVKFRLDGVLHQHAVYKPQLINGIINQIKTRSALDVSVRRIPQDGRFTRTFDGREVDFRVVTLPTSWNYESATLRLLDRSRSMRKIDKLGFHGHVLERLEKVLAASDGIIFVTGPTGSGKTTTLYAALGEVSTPERNTLAIEDPVEIRLPSITQLQVNEKAELTFARALRHFLRADPDVMLVGEIRDEETARLATQAAQTGHLVLSTLHANGASSAPLRLQALGMSNYDMSDTVRAILAQRLVRRVCPSCKTLAPLSRAEARLLSSSSIDGTASFAHANPQGCIKCEEIGYRGRLLVSELLVVDEKMSELLAAGAPVHEIHALALQSGMVSLKDDALLWLKSGDTTVEELRRTGLL